MSIKEIVIRAYIFFLGQSCDSLTLKLFYKKNLLFCLILMNTNI